MEAENAKIKAELKAQLFKQSAKPAGGKTEGETPTNKVNVGAENKNAFAALANMIKEL